MSMYTGTMRVRHYTSHARGNCSMLERCGRSVVRCHSTGRGQRREHSPVPEEARMTMELVDAPPEK